MPRTRRARVSLIGDEILGRVGGYVAGALVIALIAGVATLVWVSALGIQYPLALALIVTVTDIIPLIGATIGAVIVTPVAFFDSITVGIATGIFFVVYQQVENYLIYPRVMSRSVDVNPAAAIVGALDRRYAAGVRGGAAGRAGDGGDPADPAGGPGPTPGRTVTTYAGRMVVMSDRPVTWAT